MKNIELSSEDYQLFMLKALLWLGLASSAFLFTLVGFFYASIIWTLFAIAAIWLTSKAVQIRLHLKISREFIFAIIASLFIVIVFSTFSSPTVFTGRDQGSFSEAAARLAQNHELEFSTPASSEFFKLHESGRALNFPGFYYTKDGQLITQFSLVYISWLALFFAVFGVTGFVVANGLLLLIFLLSFYLLLRLFMKASSALPTMLLTATSFIFMWFSKFTLSENIALPLVWMTILSLMLFLKSQRKLHYLIFLFSAFLLCFARIEGIAFLVSASIIISANKEARSFVKEKTMTRFFLPTLILLAAFIADIYVNTYFYKEIVKALLPSLSMPQAQYLGEVKNNVMPDFYTVKIFYLYGLFGFFFIGAISIILKFWKKEFYRLVPLFLTLPTFIYLFDSQITPDHPWMLRRFMFSLAPVAIFYTGLLLGRLLESDNVRAKQTNKAKISALFIAVVLLAMNLPAFLKYVAYSENKGLLSQTRALSSKFSDNDLILLDREASGDGWSMLGGPMNYLYGKNAVYFFNNQDLMKLDTSKFSNVFLIVPNQKVSAYLNSTIGKYLVQTDEYSFNTMRLNTAKNSAQTQVSLPEKETVNVSGKIFKITR